MQREASEKPGKLGIFHVQLRLITVVSRLVPFRTEYSSFVASSYDALRSLTVLTTTYVTLYTITVITAREL